MRDVCKGHLMRTAGIVLGMIAATAPGTQAGATTETDVATLSAVMLKEFGSDPRVRVVTGDRSFAVSVTLPETKQPFMKFTSHLASKGAVETIVIDLSAGPRHVPKFEAATICTTVRRSLQADNLAHFGRQLLFMRTGSLGRGSHTRAASQVIRTLSRKATTREIRSALNGS